jgi:hypothetical protein
MEACVFIAKSNVTFNTVGDLGGILSTSLATVYETEGGAKLLRCQLWLSDAMCVAALGGVQSCRPIVFTWLHG